MYIPLKGGTLQGCFDGPWVGLAGQTQGPRFLKLYEISLADNLKK